MTYFFLTQPDIVTGEQGKVDESMREMAAIEALKSEKSEKEVDTPFWGSHGLLTVYSCIC